MIGPTRMLPGGRNDPVRNDRLRPGAIRRGHLGFTTGQKRERLHPRRTQPRADPRRLLGLCHLVRRRSHRGHHRRGLRQGHLRRACRSLRLRPRRHRRRIPLRGGAMAQGRHDLRRRLPRALLAGRREAGGHHPAAGLGVLGGGANPRLRAGAQLQLRPVAAQRHHPGGGAGRLLLRHRRPPGGLRDRLLAGHGRHHRAGRAYGRRRLGGRRRRSGTQRHARRSPDAGNGGARHAAGAYRSRGRRLLRILRRHRADLALPRRPFGRGGAGRHDCRRPHVHRHRLAARIPRARRLGPRASEPGAQSQAR